MGETVALYAQPAPPMLVSRSWSRVVIVLAVVAFVAGLDIRAGGLSPFGGVVGAVALIAAGSFAWDSLKMGSRQLPVLSVSESDGQLTFSRPATWRIGSLGRFRMGEPIRLLHRREEGSPLHKWRLRKDRYRMVQDGGTITWSAPTALTDESLAELEHFLNVRGCELIVSEEPVGGVLYDALGDRDTSTAPPPNDNLIAFRPQPGRPVAATLPTRSDDLTILPLGSDAKRSPDGHTLLRHDQASDHMITWDTTGIASMRITVAYEAPAHTPRQSSHAFGAWTDRLAFIDDHGDPGRIYLKAFACGVDVHVDPATPSDVVIRLRVEQ